MSREANTVALPISTWALIAGLAASAVTIVLALGTTRSVLTPPPVVWLGTWGAVFVLQAAWWGLRHSRRRFF